MSEDGLPQKKLKLKFNPPPYGPQLPKVHNSKFNHGDSVDQLELRLSNLNLNSVQHVMEPETTEDRPSHFESLNYQDFIQLLVNRTQHPSLEGVPNFDNFCDTSPNKKNRPRKNKLDSEKNTSSTH